MRAVMRKGAYDRTEDELKLLIHLVACIPAFKTHSASAHTELGRLLHFESFPEKRVVLQQGQTKPVQPRYQNMGCVLITYHSDVGDSGSSFYFVLSGSVSVVIREKGSLDKSRATTSLPHTVNQLERGDVFGDLGIHHLYAARQATIVTKAPLNEFIRIEKMEMDVILKLALRKEFEMIQAFLSQHQILGKLSAHILSDICTVSRLQTYKAHSVIMPADEFFENVYFIVSGQVRLVRSVVAPARGSERAPSPNPMLPLPLPDTASMTHTPSPPTRALSPASSRCTRSVSPNPSRLHSEATTTLPSIDARSTSAHNRVVPMAPVREYLIASGFMTRGHYFAPWIPKLAAVADQRVCIPLRLAFCLHYFLASALNFVCLS